MLVTYYKLNNYGLLFKMIESSENVTKTFSNLLHILDTWSLHNLPLFGIARQQ